MSGPAKEAKQFVESLREKNPDIKVEKGKGGHWHVKREGGLLGTIPATPSDIRSLTNSASYFRRIGLVVDVPPTKKRQSGPFGSQPGDAEQVEIAARVRKALADHGWSKMRFGALVRAEAIRLGFVAPSTDHSAVTTVANMLNGKRVSVSFLDATRAALRVIGGDPVPVVSTPITPTPPPRPMVVPTPEPELEEVVDVPVVRKDTTPTVETVVEKEIPFDSLAIRVLTRMAMGATSDEQLDAAILLARAVWELEREGRTSA